VGLGVAYGINRHVPGSASGNWRGILGTADYTHCKI
jgi:hypothetical protein